MPSFSTLYLTENLLTYFCSELRTMSQKVALAVEDNQEDVTFKGGEKLLADDLIALGLDENTPHMRIVRSYTYAQCT